MLRNGMDYILAIDPGTTESGVCLIRKKDYKPVRFGKYRNEDVMHILMEQPFDFNHTQYDLVIEMVASYGMPVGREVFETCVWIGRFIERLGYFHCGEPPMYNLIYRQEEKISICHDVRASDTTIRQALVDRFAYGTPNHGKGTKKEPGWFYGFSKDVWQAYAVGVTFLDREKGETA